MPDPLPSLSLEDEQARLAKADQDIVDGERRISRQIWLIARLSAHGHDTERSEELLATLKTMLTEWYAHRELILHAIGRLRDQRPRADSAANGCSRANKAC